MVLFQKYVRQFDPSTKMAPTAEQTRRFLWEFPIESYVKLNSAVVAILVAGLKCQT
jgi:hypothetical protein